MRELETQQLELEKQILLEKSKVVQKLSEADIREFYVKALQLEPKMLIDYIVEKVVLFDDKVEIHFNRPSHYNLEAEKGFCFFKTGPHHIHYFNANVRVYLLV